MGYHGALDGQQRGHFMKHGRLIALISQKGGAGKTTLAMQLAAGLVERGHAVAVADLDPQESALRWSEACPEGMPFPAPVERLSGGDAEFDESLAALGRRRDFVVLDCPPSIEHPHVLAALDRVDLALVPVVPSPPDLWSARAVERLILLKMAERKRLRGALVPNRVQRTALSASVLEVMREFSLPVLAATLAQRNAYAQSAVAGGSVFRLGRAAEAAQLEVDRLAAAVTEMLKGAPD